MQQSLDLARQGQTKTIAAIEKAAIAKERLADETFRWRCIFGVAIFTTLVTFVPPFRVAYVNSLVVAGAVIEEGDRAIDFFSGGSRLDKSTLKVGDTVNGARQVNLSRPTYQVTSGYGPRNIGTAGASKNHRGVDLDTPTGTKQYIPFNIETEIACKIQYNDKGEIDGAGYYAELDFTYQGQPWKVRSFHLKPGSCTSGVMTGGQAFALSGASGAGDGPHTHIEVLPNGQHVNPYRGVVEAMLSGDPISGEKQ